MSKITIEEIDGELMTVVWHSEAFIQMEGILLNRDGSWFWQTNKDGTVNLYFNRPMCNAHIATALPALPRHPKPEDAPLLYRYCSEGLIPYLDDGRHSGLFNGRHLNGSWLVFTCWGDDMYDGMGICDLYKTKITHATFAGERVEIAIKD